MFGSNSSTSKQTMASMKAAEGPQSRGGRHDRPSDYGCEPTQTLPVDFIRAQRRCQNWWYGSNPCF